MDEAEHKRRADLDDQLNRAGKGIAQLRVTQTAARAAQILAEHHGVSVEQYVDALLNYAWSLHRRPGSWEANVVFDFVNYRAPEQFEPGVTPVTAGCADTWWTPPEGQDS